MKVMQLAELGLRKLKLATTQTSSRWIGAVILLLATTSASASTNSSSQATVIVAVGASGEDIYAKDFESSATNWVAAAARSGATCVTIGLGATNETTDLDQLRRALRDEPKESSSELWLVLIGHGTFDGKEAKFNLRGPDLTASELSDALKPFNRPIAIINCASASGPFLNALSATNRVIVTATRSGYEQNYSRFGAYIAEAITNPEADLDRDGQTSLLEAYLTASRRVAEFYETEGRLATEHALIDDNGDGLGTPADWFRGIHAVKKPKEGALLDGLRAHQFHLVRSEQEDKMPPAVRTRRDELEVSIAQLRESKKQMAEDAYYEQLEKLLIEMAKLYQSSNQK